MNLPLPLLTIVLLLTPSLYSQSGRRANKDRQPTPPPAATPTPPAAPPSEPDPQVTAERDQDYRCTDDGTLARIIEDETPTFLSAKEVDERAVIVKKPRAGYTRVAREYGVQGQVVVRVVFSSNKKIDRVRVVRGLPGGLNENAIRAACKIEFKPALKAGQPVSQWLNVEYIFRLTDSSFQP
jgi:TonB family protein